MVVGWFKKLKTSLSKSSDKISGGIKKILKSKKIDANRYTNKYFERNPIAPNKPIKKQSLNFIFLVS